MSVDYNQLAKTNILMADIECNGKKDNVTYHKYKPDILLSFCDDVIELFALDVLSLRKKQIPFKSIKYEDLVEVTLSLCKRNYGTTASIIINEYHIDIIIKLNNGMSYHLESQSWRMLCDFTEMLKNNNVLIIDQFNIVDQFIKNGCDVHLNLDEIFDDLTKSNSNIVYRVGNKR